MSRINNPLELYKSLPRTNCRKCRLATCLAFAAAVIKGERNLEECPLLDQTVIGELSARIEQHNVNSGEQQLARYLDDFKKVARRIDFPSVGRKLGAASSPDKMTIRCLGKRYTLDSAGNVTSECHINQWVVGPLVNYVMHSAGKEPSGQWVHFRELKNGDMWNPLFEQRCEKPLKLIADNHFDLFEYLLYVFGGRPSPALAADASFVLHPLPKVPLGIGYSNAHAGGESRLSVLFDATAQDNLAIESIFGLATGMVTMMQKIAERHA